MECALHWRTSHERALSRTHAQSSGHAVLGSSYDRNETRMRGRSNPPPTTPLQLAQIKQQALCKRSMLALLCNPRLQEALLEPHAATIITFAFFPPSFFSLTCPHPLGSFKLNLVTENRPNATQHCGASKVVQLWFSFFFILRPQNHFVISEIIYIYMYLCMYVCIH